MQETLIAAWQAGRHVPPAGAGPAAQPSGVTAGRRAGAPRGAALGRLVAAGDPLPPWLTGHRATPTARPSSSWSCSASPSPSGCAVRRPTGARPPRRDATGAARPTGPTVPLPAIPADLAAERPIAAALVRAGAPVGAGDAGGDARSRRRAAGGAVAPARTA